MRHLVVVGGVVVVSLAACHLVMPVASAPDSPSSSDGPIQRSPNEDAGGEADSQAPARHSDLMAHESTRPDVPAHDSIRPPDLRAHDSAPQGLYLDFLGGPGPMTLLSCTWTATGGALNQQTTSFNGCFIRYDVSTKDYEAETVVTIDTYYDKYNWVEGAGIAVRLQAAASLPNTPGGYVCTVSPADDLLFLARCPGGASNSCPIMKKIPASIDLGVAVLVRAAVVGNQVTCSLPQKGISFSYTDPAPFAGGGAGFVTFHASAMFDYLKVTPLP